MRGQTLMSPVLWHWDWQHYSRSRHTVSSPHQTFQYRPLIACFIEWKGRSDGLLAHVFFERNANFALSTFAFAVEGWIFYSAVNSVVPQIVLNLGFETDSWAISIRQLSYSLLTMFASIPITWYATAFKDLKTPLLVTFTIFLVV